MTLLAAYNFDDLASATIVDRSGNGHDISLTGQPGAQVESGGLLDDGALGKTGAGLIPLPAGLQAVFEVDDRSIMLDVLGLRSVWVARAASDAFGTGVFGLLSLDAATIISRARTQANVGPSATITLGALSSTVRHNFCLTYKRSTGVLTGYYDGNPVGTATFTPGTALYVGADDFDMAEWASTGPAVDNLRFFDHTLSDAEVLALAGTPVTASVEEHSGSVTLSASAALISAGVKTVSRTAQLTAATAVAPVSSKTAARSTTLAAAADLEMAGTHVGARTESLTTSTGLAVAGSPVRYGSVTLAASVSIETGPPAEEHDITLTATLAAQPAADITVGARRWTATLGEQP